MEDDNGDVEQPLIQVRQRHVIFETFARYLLVQECLEIVALRGLMTILGVFLLEHLHFNEGSATQIVHAFFVGTLLSSVIGSLLSDGFLGTYRAVYAFSFCEFCGYVLLLSTSLPNAVWPSSSTRVYMTYSALFLVAVGFGGLRPCTATFGGDQMMRLVKEKYGDDEDGALARYQKKATEQYFSAYYGSLTAGVVLSAVIFPLVRVQAKGNYLYVFLMSACAMPLGTLSFWLGTSQYRFESSEKTWRSQSPEEVLNVETPKFSADYEAVVPAANKNASKREDWKILFSALIVLSPTPFLTALEYQTSSTWVFQARQMDGRLSWLGGWEIPPDEIGAVKPIFQILLIPVLDELIYPFVGTYIVAVTSLRKMVTGAVIATLSFVIAGVLQVIIDFKLQEKPMGGLEAAVYADISRLWQVPQYMAMSLAEVMMLISIVEWAYHEAPKSLKTVVNGAHNVYQAIGNLIIIVVVALLGSSASKVTQVFLFAGIGALGAVLLAIFSYRYVPREARIEEARQKHLLN